MVVAAAAVAVAPTTPCAIVVVVATNAVKPNLASQYSDDVRATNVVNCTMGSQKTIVRGYLLHPDTHLDLVGHSRRSTTHSSYSKFLLKKNILS
jgi:hypothetical protein